MSKVVGADAEGATFRDCCKLEKSCFGTPLADPKSVMTVRLCGKSSSSSLVGTGVPSVFDTCSSLSASGSLLCGWAFRALSRSTRLFATLRKASTLACRAVSGGEVVPFDESFPPLAASSSVEISSTSLWSACRESYEPSCIRLAMVAEPVGGVNLARLESASPDELRVIAEEMVCVNIEGCVS